MEVREQLMFSIQWQFKVPIFAKSKQSAEFHEVPRGPAFIELFIQVVVKT